MSLPDQIRVRISSEAAGSISMTPVVNQSVPLRQLIETVLATTGKDPARVREVLVRGAVVQGASRFRWEPLAAEAVDLEPVLRTFPDADPSRRFAAERCLLVRLRSPHQAIDVPKEIAAPRRLWKRRSFWDTLMELAGRSHPGYLDYSYRTRADEYRLPLTRADVASLGRDAGLLRHPGLALHIRETPLESADYLVRYP